MDHVRRAESELYCCGEAVLQLVCHSQHSMHTCGKPRFDARPVGTSPRRSRARHDRGHRRIDFGNERYGRSILSDVERGMRGAHAQSDLRDEDGVESSVDTTSPRPVHADRVRSGDCGLPRVYSIVANGQRGRTASKVFSAAHTAQHGIDELESWLAAACVAAILPAPTICLWTR